MTPRVSDEQLRDGIEWMEGSALNTVSMQKCLDIAIDLREERARTAALAEAVATLRAALESARLSLGPRSLSPHTEIFVAIDAALDATKDAPLRPTREEWRAEALAWRQANNEGGNWNHAAAERARLLKNANEALEAAER